MNRGLIQRHVRWSGGLHLQYREAGRGGMPLVLLHASPRCSAMYEPWMQQLADQFHVLAVDTPGYGGSDPLPMPPASLADYVAPLHHLLSEVIGHIEYDPTPQYAEEPGITMAEMHSGAWAQHQAMHS